MTTKAQAFRTQQRRAANPPKAKTPTRPRRDLVVDTSKPGVSASDRKVGGGKSGGRNKVGSTKKHGGAALEDSATGKPSRKSTRASSTGVKRTSNLRLRASRKASAPKTLAAKARARGTGGKSTTTKK